MPVHAFWIAKAVVDLPPLMAPTSSSPHRLTTPNPSTPAVSPASNKKLAPSCFTDASSTALFLLLSVLSQRPNQQEPPQQPHHPAPQLLCHSLRCHYLLNCQRHAPPHSQERFLPFRNLSPLPCRWLLLSQRQAQEASTLTTHRHLSMAPSMFTHP